MTTNHKSPAREFLAMAARGHARRMANMRQATNPVAETEAIERDFRMRCQADGKCHPMPTPAVARRPDVDAAFAHRLRMLAALMMKFNDRANGQSHWREQIEDTEQVREFCKRAHELMSPLIAEVLAAAEQLERKVA